MNNMVNVAIVILSTTVIEGVIDFSQSSYWLEFTIQVIGVTFVILLLGEVTPKIFANNNSIKVAGIMSAPILFFRQICWPLSSILIKSSSLIDSRIKKRSSSMTVDELGHALEITMADEGTTTEEKKILQGIVKFGNTNVRQVMTPRMDVVAFDITTRYFELIAKIIDSGFSRVPVYEETPDHIKGVLYIKDLIPFLDEKDDFKWQNLIREAFFVPDNKKLDDLLKEFKDSKIHLAVVVDEYGGTLGIVTLEDVIEEIVGEITDEFDDEDISYTRIDENNFVFEGKTALIDIYRILEIEGDEFEEKKGDADTLAGFLLELSGNMPDVNEVIKFLNYTFIVEAVDKRRIKQVKITIDRNKEPRNGNGNKSLFFSLIAFIFLLCSCGGEEPLPKPKGYMRIDLPEKNYVRFSGDCPYEFDYPTYSYVVNKGMKEEEHCFKNIEFEELHGTLHLTYKALNDNVSEFIEDCHELAYEHSVRATSIDRKEFTNDSTKVYGLLYDIKGNAASPLQFYVTDSTRHFIRGAFYFMAKPNYDSIQPVLQFVREDIARFMESVTWK
jgi:putative hemolysin